MEAIGRRMGQPSSEPGTVPGRRARSMQVDKRASMHRMSLQAHFSAAAAHAEAEREEYELPERQRQASPDRNRRGSTASRDGREMAALLRHSRQSRTQQRAQPELAGTSRSLRGDADRSAGAIQSGVWPANVRASHDALESSIADLL